MPINSEASRLCVINSETQKSLDHKMGLKQGWGLVTQCLTSTLKAWVCCLHQEEKNGPVLPCLTQAPLCLGEEQSALSAESGRTMAVACVRSSQASWFFSLHSDGLAVVTLIGIIVGVLLAIGFVGGIIIVVMRKVSGRFS